MSNETVTRQLASMAVDFRLADVPEPVQMLAKQAILDWLGVTFAGSDEPVTDALVSYTASDSGRGPCSVIGRAERIPASAAAWVNGTASHALDYDDVNFSIPGHATAPVLSAVLALAEETRATGARLLEAFIAGYETACRVGQLVAPNHYARGFHATATVGCFGAAAAAGNLLRLDARTVARAFGITAIQAAGLKVSFGTSCKPLQVGVAARAGLVAARLAQLGVDAPTDIFDHRLGFAPTHSDDRSPDAALGPACYVADFAKATLPDAPAYPFHLQTNLFKYHASCYETHSSIESALALVVADRVAPADVASISIQVAPHADDICNIMTPTTSLEAKFSLRHTVAMALLGKATASPATYEETFGDPEVRRLQERAAVVLDDTLRVPQAVVQVTTQDGRAFEQEYDSSIPNADLDTQQEKLRQKFRSLAADHVSLDVIDALEKRVMRIEAEGDVADLMGLTACERSRRRQPSVASYA